MANMTTTTHAVFIPEVWSKEIIAAVEKNLVLANLVWRFDGDATVGNKINVPNVSNFTTQSKVAGVSTVAQATTETEVEIDINTHEYVKFIVEDITKIQASHDLMGVYTGKAGYAIAEKVDTDLAALASGFSQTYGTFNTAITTDVILDSVQALDDADAPQSERYFVFQPDVKRDLLDIDRYVSMDFVNQKGVTNGMVGEIYGLKTFMSTNVLKSGNNTSNMIFHKDALALALQLPARVQGEYDHDELGHKVTVDTIYGVKEMRDTFGVLVKT